jgi:hypothetical protein
MGELNSHQEAAAAAVELSHLSRRPAAITAVLCGIMTMLALTASIYTAIKTPTVHEVPYYIDHQFIRTESKGFYLLIFPLFSIFVFAAVASIALRWNEFRRKAAERETFWKQNFEGMGRLDVVILVKVACTFFTLFQVILCFAAFYRCYTLLLG